MEITHDNFQLPPLDPQNKTIQPADEDQKPITPEEAQQIGKDMVERVAERQLPFMSQSEQTRFKN